MRRLSILLAAASVLFIVEWVISVNAFEGLVAHSDYGGWVRDQKPLARRLFLTIAPVLLQPSAGIFRHYIKTSGRSWSRPIVRAEERLAARLTSMRAKLAVFAIGNSCFWLFSFVGLYAVRRLRRRRRTVGPPG